jgi:NADP-dependent 3-hydroxy acid dehydrogenase YdfG
MIEHEQDDIGRLRRRTWTSEHSAPPIHQEELSHQESKEMTGIDGKVVAITGASSGIGRAAALLLAGRGAKVVLGARRTDELEALVREIKGAGGDAIHNGTNVAKREDVAALIALACDRYGKLDVLISNAGIGPISKLEDLRVENWEEMVDINIKGLLYGIAAALPIFRRQALAISSIPFQPLACR